MKRRKMSKRGSKKYFTKNAVRVRQQNNWQPMRGGIRL
jgi:hypothetical protein